MEIVPGYTLIAPLGSGMAGDVWQAQAAGGIKVALKVVRNLKDLGGRKELKALKTIRDVHHPNLCPLFGFWTKDADGRVLADGETEDLTFDSVSAAGLAHLHGDPAVPPGPVSSEAPSDGTMAIGSGMPSSPPPATPSPDAETKPAKPKVTAEQLIVVMGLGDCTLYDRLKYVRQEAGLGPESVDVPFGLDPVETIRYLRASASAIDLLNQEHQIYHCDIKPQNILLVGGEAQVCDFGLAKQMEGDMRQTQQAFATPAYAPPEVLHNEGYSRQVDQYSLAVTYYELRTGLLPFDITTHASMLVAKSTGKLNLDALTPPERKVLSKALRRVPNERYGSCTEFINAIAVASGVDKSGGITVGRIISAVAAIFVFAAIGIASWRYVDPVGFNSFFFSSKVRTAQRLGDAQEMFQTTETENFEAAQLPLTEVMGVAAEVATETKGELKGKAETLFADATMRLLSRIHETLQQIESNQNGTMSETQQKKLESSLALLDFGRSDPKSPILRWLQGWIEAESPAVRNTYEEFRSLFHAAAIRFDLLRRVESPPSHLDGLRQALDERPQDFSNVAAIDFPLASLLPVLGTTPEQAFRSWTAADWLIESRLEDLIRAENSVRQFGAAKVYARRWSEIREAFTIAVEPAITGTDPSVSKVDEPTKQRVLAGFPDLQLEKQFAELRQSIQQSQWQAAQQLLDDLTSGRPLTPNQSVILTCARALIENRDKENALELTKKAIDDAAIPSAQLRELRTQPLFISYMQGIGQRSLETTSPPSIALFTQMRFARWLADELGSSIPAEFLSAAAISLLRQNPELISDPESAGELQLDRWVELLRDSNESVALAAAIELEKQIAAKQPDLAVVGSSIKILESAERKHLDRVSAIYTDYLFACGGCLNAQDISALIGQLTTTSKESIEALGDTRIYLGTDLLVRGAVQASGVTDDNFVTLRYSRNSASSADLTRAGSYLSLAEFLIRHTAQGTTTTLANELLVQAAASAATGLDQIEIPSVIDNRLDDLESVEGLPIHVLVAVHRIGIEKHAAATDAQKSELATRLLLRPAMALIQRYGIERFGPRTGDSKAKEVLLRSILEPTVSGALFAVLRFDNGAILPSGLIPESSLDLRDLSEFCQLATDAYSDPMAQSLYQDAERFRRQRVALAVIASTGKSLTDASRQQYLMRMAESAVALRDCSGDQLLAAADKALRFNASTETVDYLRSDAHERIARTLDMRSAKADALAKALAAAESALAAFQRQPELADIAKKQKYEVLAKCADLGVQLAFLRGSVDEKLALLNPSLLRGDQAIALYDDSWQTLVNFPLVSTYLSKGNACEDIAHYCSVGDDPETVARREKHFALAIEAFREARDRNADDFKTRFSLGRCQYRYALTLEGKPSEQQLMDASQSLGRTPTQADADSGNRYQVATMAEWFLWKIKVESEQKNLNEAIELAAFAFQFVKKDTVPLDLRNALSKECGVVYGKNRQWDEAANCLLFLEGQGPIVEVIQRMGTLSDIAYRQLASDQELFTKLLKTLNDLNKLGTLEDADDATYALAKIATRCMREEVVGLSSGRSVRSTNTKLADLSRGIRAFVDQLNPQSQGRYLRLANVFRDGDIAAQNINHTELFRFACQLSVLMKSDPDFPSYIRSNCSLIVFHCLAYWGSQTANMNEDQKQRERQTVQAFLTPQYREGLIDGLAEFKAVAAANNDEQLIKLSDDAIQMVNDLFDTKE